MEIIVFLLVLVIAIIILSVIFETFRMIMFGIIGLIVLMIIWGRLNKNKPISNMYKLFGKNAMSVLTKQTISCRNSGKMMDGKETIVDDVKYIYVHKYERFFPECDYKLIRKYEEPEVCTISFDDCGYEHQDFKTMYVSYNQKDFNRLVEETKYCTNIGAGLDGKLININDREYRYYHKQRRYYTIEEYELVTANQKKIDEEKFQKQEEMRREQERRERQKKNKQQESSNGDKTAGSKLEQYCKVLGVDPAMVKDKEFLKAAYRARVKKIHPDAGGSDKEAQTVNEAYDFLDKY